jgi:hypothetical protein
MKFEKFMLGFNVIIYAIVGVLLAIYTLLGYDVPKISGNSIVMMTGPILYLMWITKRNSDD